MLVVPSRRILAEAEATNDRLGHENLGFLSESHGFLPRERPLLELGSSHSAWDDVASRLPELVRDLTLRPALGAMPVLGAGEDALPDGDLLRASVILSIFAHAHYYVQTEPPDSLPASVTAPWEEISRRLERPRPHLSFIDMNLYNWRSVDDDPAAELRVENLSLLIPVVGNEDERRFQMTPVEAVDRLTPTVGAIVRAQEAVAGDDARGLEHELTVIADALAELTTVTFAKVNPNRYSSTYVDPVVWGKTVAPIATPFDPAIPGPSGTAIPSFQLLDVFFGRTYDTRIGLETDRARSWFPPHWRAFLDAADNQELSVAEYVRRRGDRVLRGVFQEALDAYAGDGGLLARHRLKTYGYLDLSFKAGRTKTLGGIDGGFADRVWDSTDGELEHARRERYTSSPETWQHVGVKEVRALRDDDATWVGQVVLDVEGAGIRYRPGGRCAVLPENEDDLVERTVRALRARGDEPIELSVLWRAAIAGRDGHQDATVLPLRTLLRFGRIRPVDRDVAKRLYSITHDHRLRRIVERRAEDQWELWELLELLHEAGFAPAALLRAHPGERESICRIVPPERPRVYSISSAMEDPTARGAREIHLTLGRLRYDTEAGEVSRAGTRDGTASSFLARGPEGPISIKVIRPPRFALPKDPRTPIVMFAGGTGLAPFRSMLLERSRQAQRAETWLYFATRTRADLYHGDELRRLEADGVLQLRVALSAEPGHEQRIGALLLEDDNARRLRRLIDEGAVLYVCGRAGFAGAVTDAIAAVLERFAEGSDRERCDHAAHGLRRLVGEERYLLEVYTTYTGSQHRDERIIDASEVAEHNSEQDGYWMTIAGRVYDLTAFASMHPGGLKIMRSYAGMDATVPYRKVLHDVNPEVDAMLAMYEIGRIRRLDLGSAWCVAISADGLRAVTAKDLYRAWITRLYAAVEMQNAVANDFGIRHEPVTHDEIDGPPSQSAYKTQLLFQAHQRFRRDYLDALTGTSLEQLWALTSAASGTRHRVGWMQASIRSTRDGDEARAAARLDERIAAGLTGAGDLASCVTRCQRLEVADKRFMQEMKLGLLAGLRVFERWERHTLPKGGPQLLAAVRGLPEVLERYFASVAEIERGDRQR